MAQDGVTTVAGYADTQVVVAKSDLVLLIVGGNISMTVPADFEAVVLDASGSFDPDNTSAGSAGM